MTLRHVATTACAIACLSAVSATNAHAVTIDFNNLTSGTAVSTQYQSLGVSFVAGGFTGTGFTTGQNWATNTDLTATSTDLNGTFTGNGNLLHAYNNGWLNENGDPVFTINLSSAITGVSLSFYSINSTYATGSRIFAYNGNTLINSAAATAAGGTTQTLSLTGISSATKLIVTPGTYNDWVAVDNLVISPAAVVPEAGTLALLGTSLPLLGGAVVLRRRFKQSV